MAMQQHLDFYRQPSAMTSLGKYAPLFKSLPDDIGDLVHIVQGVTLHQYWARAYEVAVPEARKAEMHVRPLEAMIECLLAQDGQPPSIARRREQRFIGICRHFAVLLVALLRLKGVPARMRGGFASYFDEKMCVDHWICEYWDSTQSRWILVDAQIDEVHRKSLTIDFDPLDVPSHRFLIAGNAWAQCRAGQADPAKFGIMELCGWWFIAGDVTRDVAALNKIEMLPWDCWGNMPRPNEPLSEEQFAFFDHLAALTRDPDASFEEIRDLYANDDRIRVPPTIFNSILNRVEALEGLE